MGFIIVNVVPTPYQVCLYQCAPNSKEINPPHCSLLMKSSGNFLITLAMSWQATHHAMLGGLAPLPLFLGDMFIVLSGFEERFYFSFL